MKILWLAWKDIKHPQAGGAEVVNEELAKRLVADGHEVLFLVGGFAGGDEMEERDGFKIVRLGNRFSVYYYAYKYYQNNLVGWADLVIDEVNTIPFFAKFYVSSPSTGLEERAGVRSILFIHQLAREIWFYQMFFPLSLIGYILEPLYLRLLNDQVVITVSDSTRQDLLACGFKRENIKIISEGIHFSPLTELEFKEPLAMCKFVHPTVLSFGSVRPMKRTMNIVEAFEIAKVNIPDLRLKIAGDISGSYGERVKKYIAKSEHQDSIDVLGRVSDDEKKELMRRAHVLAVTSLKEGWGLVVSEANSQGTPAVVYNADGLRDSVRHNITGLVCKYNKPDDLAANLIALFGNENDYSQLRQNAWEWSKDINFERSYKDFLAVLQNLK